MKVNILQETTLKFRGTTTNNKILIYPLESNIDMMVKKSLIFINIDGSAS